MINVTENINCMILSRHISLLLLTKFGQSYRYKGSALEVLIDKLMTGEKKCLKISLSSQTRCIMNVVSVSQKVNTEKF